MKKLFLSLAALALIFTSCESDKNDMLQEQSKIDMSDFFVYTDSDNGEQSRNGFTPCHSMTNLNRLLEEDPGLYKKMYNIEYNTRKFATNAYRPGNGNGNGGGPGGGDGGGGGTPDDLGVITIPVYVHVIYSNAQQNISSTQINSQMSVLNDDFRAANNDVNQVPGEFAGLVADTEVQFSLAGTYRYPDDRGSWGTNDAMKAAYPPVTPETHLNIWVCNIGGGILGYAQFPGGPIASDGVVVSPQYFGTTGFVSAPFDGGRTLTHEVGHYLNLRHIWGDGRCNRDDFVSDTPTSDAPNYGCPSYPTVNCRSNDMTMNYMDYVNDDCMYMFSSGQKTRMRSVFQSGGPRAGMAN
ncbi:Pregnancy-associated plasma protein-A [Formosa sp. Hel1_31_208]|uniref:zinc metalloprotease n=1 Tax=Formosa sp. Hel1_31_208 TaxID=1798225 RepID=UPI00087B4ABF|nr:zinc metalloprotease [Formosa sp. Hel1_31_208]SDR70707.1 Pregnancy-associated plasma protein-A [Formosa sp. Hel1_31_208]